MTTTIYVYEELTEIGQLICREYFTTEAAAKEWARQAQPERHLITRLQADERGRFRAL